MNFFFVANFYAVKIQLIASEERRQEGSEIPAPGAFSASDKCQSEIDKY